MDNARIPQGSWLNRVTIPSHGRLLLVTAALFLLAYGPAGCRETPKRVMGTGTALPKSQLSREELGETLNRFEDFFTTSVKQGASELDMLLPGQKTQRSTLLWRTRCIDTLHTVLDQEDPLVAFIDTWALSLRMTLYFGSGEGSKLFEPHQEVALSTATQIESEIERIARKLLEPTIFEQTQRDLQTFAQTNPIRGAFSRTLVYASEVKTEAPGPIATVVNLPLAPFRAIEGVDRGSMAIRDFSTTAERFSDIVEELPESTRWQLLLALYELEQTDMVQSFLASLAQFAASSDKLAGAAERLPGQIRTELTAYTEEIDAKQANLQQTLQAAQATSQALTTLVAQVDTTASTLSTTAADVQKTGEAWQATIDSIGTTFNLPRPKPDANRPSQSTMGELNATARAITEAAVEIRQLNGELAANATLWSAQTSRLTTNITWKLAGLMGLAFVLALLYRVLTLRLSRGKAAPQ